jgi:hypothetical protein
MFGLNRLSVECEGQFSSFTLRERERRFDCLRAVCERCMDRPLCVWGYVNSVVDEWMMIVDEWIGLYE